MITTFDIFAVVVGQIKLFMDHYTRKTQLREISLNQSRVSILDNMLITNPELAPDETVDVGIDHIISNSAKSANGSKMLCTMIVAHGLELPFVDMTLDTLTLTADNSPIPERANGYLFVVPKKLFDNDTDFDDTLKILMKLFLDILSFDKLLKYVPNEALFKNIGKKYIPSYDICLLASACACVSISLKTIFNFSDNYAEFILEPYESIMEKRIYTNMRTAIDRYGIKIGILRDAISDGSFLGTVLSVR